VVLVVENIISSSLHVSDTRTFVSPSARVVIFVTIRGKTQEHIYGFSDQSNNVIGWRLCPFLVPTLVVLRYEKSETQYFSYFQHQRQHYYVLKAPTAHLDWCKLIDRKVGGEMKTRTHELNKYFLTRSVENIV
jgi:hypothetical protein